VDNNKRILAESTILLNEGLWSKFKEWRKKRRHKKNIRINAKEINDYLYHVKDGKAFLEMYTEMIRINNEVKRMKGAVRQISITHMLAFCELVEDWELFLVYEYFIKEYKKNFSPSNSFQYGEREFKEYFKKSQPLFASAIKTLDQIGNYDHSLKNIDKSEYYEKTQQERKGRDQNGNETTEIVDVILDHSVKSVYALHIFDSERLLPLLNRRVREQKEDIDRIFRNYKNLHSLE
jgi:hypothetical protein